MNFNLVILGIVFLGVLISGIIAIRLISVPSKSFETLKPKSKKVVRNFKK